MADNSQIEPPSAMPSIQSKIARVAFLQDFLLGILTFPYRRTFKLYTWKPLHEIRYATGDRKTLIRLVKDWKENKYAELQSVQVAASFCAGATLAVFTWQKENNPLWVSDALWYTSLMCSIWAVITSIQVKSILDDLPSNDELNDHVPDLELKRTKRVILGYKKRPGLKYWIMLFVWQFPSMFMSYAWVTFMVGLTMYACTPLIRRYAWGDDSKTAVVFLSVGSVGLLTFIFSTAFVHAAEKGSEQSIQITRVSTFDMLESGNDQPLNGNASASFPTQALRSKILLIDDSAKGSQSVENSSRRKQVLLT